MADERVHVRGDEGGEEQFLRMIEHIDDEPKSEGVTGSYIEKVEQASEQDDNDTTSTASGDDGGAVVPFVLPANAVVLPVTQDEFAAWENAEVTTSARWLREWCRMMIRKYGSRVFFRG